MNDDAVMVERPLCSWCDSFAATTYRGDPACKVCADRLTNAHAEDVIADADWLSSMSPSLGWALALLALIALSGLLAWLR